MCKAYPPLELQENIKKKQTHNLLSHQRPNLLLRWESHGAGPGMNYLWAEEEMWVEREADSSRTASCSDSRLCEEGRVNRSEGNGQPLAC